MIERERKTTAQIQRRGRVIDAQSPDCHSGIIKSRLIQEFAPAQRPAMGPLGILFHLSSFIAPAVVVGVLVAWFARLAYRPAGPGSWWKHALGNSLAGVFALAAGLAFFGVDGKMATYAALVAAIAFSQWIFVRGRKG